MHLNTSSECQYHRTGSQQRPQRDLMPASLRACPGQHREQAPTGQNLWPAASAAALTPASMRMRLRQHRWQGHRQLSSASQHMLWPAASGAALTLASLRARSQQHRKRVKTKHNCRRALLRGRGGACPLP